VSTTLTLHITASPFAEDGDFPWSYSALAFQGWVHEVLLAGYKNNQPLPSLQQATSIATDRGYTLHTTDDATWRDFMSLGPLEPGVPVVTFVQDEVTGHRKSVRPGIYAYDANHLPVPAVHVLRLTALGPSVAPQPVSETWVDLEVKAGFAYWLRYGLTLVAQQDPSDSIEASTIYGMAQDYGALRGDDVTDARRLALAHAVSLAQKETS